MKKEKIAICTTHQILAYLGDQFKDVQVGRTCSTHRTDDYMHLKTAAGKPEGK
jgi:hypothetical protein